MYNWYQKCFLAIAVLIVFHSANEKNRRQQDYNKTANQERKIKTLLSLPIHLAHHRSTIAPLSLRCPSGVAPLLHRYCTAIVPLSLCRYRSAAVALLLRCCRTAIVPVLLHCRSASVAPAVATQSHCYCTRIAPLSLRCCYS